MLKEKFPVKNILELTEAENLTGRNLRLILKSEEELHQTVNFTRIFPCKNSLKFLGYLAVPSYNDWLLESWETRYREQRVEGWKLLEELCKKGHHLENIEVNAKNMSKFLANKKVEC